MMGVGIFTVLIPTLIFCMVAPAAHAQTIGDDSILEEIEKLKSEKKFTDRQIEQKRTEIKQQQNTITQLQQKIEQSEKNIEKIRSESAKSWDLLRELPGHEAKHESLVESLEPEKQKIPVLKQELSKLILQSKLLNSDIIKAERKYDESRFTTFDTDSITKLVGIQLSRACETMIKNNITTPCPTYETLEQFDSSLKESGEFEYDDNGFYSRAEPQYENPWRYYDHDSTPRIIVDPPKGMNDRIAMITIESDFDVYFLPENMHMKNNTRTWYEDRYIDNCRTAVIGADDWQKILVDTIYTLHNKCTHTTIDVIKSETMPVTELPIEDTRYWKDKVWLEESKEKCKQLCREY